jgi:hypothetical protein
VLKCRRASTHALYGTGRPKPDDLGDAWLYFPKGKSAGGAARFVASDPEPEAEETFPDVSEEVAEFRANITPELRTELAERLGVPAWALDDFPDVGWHENHRRHLDRRVWTFPCVDPEGRPIGLATRSRHGKKKFVGGGHAGLFVTPGWKTAKGDIHVGEGPTDSFALHAAGITAICRPGAKARIAMLAAALKDVPESRRIIVTGEWDENEKGERFGRQAAYKVAVDLARRLNRVVWWSMPPRKVRVGAKWVSVKDARDWFIAKAQIRDRHPDACVRALRALNRRGTPVTQSRAKWKKLGKEYAAAVSAQAVAVRPEMATPPYTKIERPCEAFHTLQLKGKAARSTEGKRALIDCRCLRWYDPETCTTCARFKTNRHTGWIWKCFFAAADPLRLPDRNPDVDPEEASVSPWPERVDHTKAGPWTLHAAVVTRKRLRSIQGYLSEHGGDEKLDSPLCAYHAVKLPPGIPRAAKVEHLVVLLQSGRRTTKCQDLGDDRLLVIVGLSAEVPPPRGLTTISADDAAELAEVAHAAIEHDPDPDPDAERGRPISASAYWQMPSTALRPRRWKKESTAGLSASEARKVTDRLDATEEHDSVDAETVQDSAVRTDAAVGGELASWFMMLLFEPQHVIRTAEGAADDSAIAARLQRWRHIIDGIADGPDVRSYLIRHAVLDPDPTDRPALIAAAERDAATKDTRDELAEIAATTARTDPRPWISSSVKLIVAEGKGRIERAEQDRKAGRPAERVGDIRAEILSRVAKDIDRGSDPVLCFFFRDRVLELTSEVLRTRKKPKWKRRPPVTVWPKPNAKAVDGFAAIAH